MRVFTNAARSNSFAPIHPENIRYNPEVLPREVNAATDRKVRKRFSSVAMNLLI